MAAPSHGTSKVSGFLQEPLAPAIIQGVTAPRLKRAFPDALRWFPAINRAHLVMLTERGLIDAATAGRLLAQVDALEAEGIDAFTLDPEREDPWFNYEAELTRRIGAEGGRLHVARSRNDLKTAQDRMRLRAVAETLLEQVTSLREALLERSATEADTIMPGYTHLQHAQPITFGWYLLGVEAALDRDATRFEDALTRMDECPLGAGALAGTRFDIDRARVAELLGFARPQEHPLDAVGNRDAMIELTSAAMQLAMTVGRMAQDFYLWSTFEFGMLDFPDRVASTSSIMPQKKNYTILENLKAASGPLIGAVTTAVNALRSVPFGHSQEVSIESSRWVWEALDDLSGILPAAVVVVESAAPRRDRMLALTTANFATATTLADLLVTRQGLPFREAHHITGRYVRLKLDGASAEDAIRRAYAEQTGAELEEVANVLAEALDPRGMLDAVEGCSPSREETRRLHNLAQASITRSRDAALARHAHQDAANETLTAACAKLKAAARQEENA